MHSFTSLLRIDPERFYTQAYAWLLNVGPRILFAILALVLGEWLIGIFRKWLRKAMHRKQIDPSLRPFLVSAIGVALQVLLLLGVVQIIGVQMTVFTALVGAFGVAAGLALSGTLQNFTSGIVILLLKPYKVGDAIAAQGQEGLVCSIQIFYTVVTTYDNKTVIIPNSKLSNELIVNLSREGNRRLDVELKFGYGFPVEEVKKVAKDTIESMDTVLKDPAHRIGISQVDTDGFKLMINLWVPAHGFQDMKYAFQERLIENFKAAGIKLPGMT